MAGFDKSKRSVVKHKTQRPYGEDAHSQRNRSSGQGSSRGGHGAARDDTRPRRGGFNVGPRNAPDGAYLGKVKRIKANLIANAKTKKQFYKSVKGKERDDAGTSVHQGGPTSDGSTDLGRFAPESGGRTETGSSRAGSGSAARVGSDGDAEDVGLVRRRDRAGPAPSANGNIVPTQNRKRKRPDNSQSPQKVLPSTNPEPAKQTRKPKYESKEEALAAREQRQEKWNRISGSAKGRSRGQPDLGARMEVLLDRIKTT